MMTKTKTICALSIAATLCLTSVSALASSWKLKDYDTSDEALTTTLQTDKVAKIYAEYGDNGLPTGRILSSSDVDDNQIKGADGSLLTGYAQASWRDKWIDKAYPNASYVKLYADGNYTGVVRATGAVSDCEYRWANYGWEAETHEVYQIKQAKLPFIGWYGGQDGAVPLYPTQYAGYKADVKIVRERTGIDMASLPAIECVATMTPTRYEDTILRTYTETTWGPVYNFDGSISKGKEYALAAPSKILVGDDYAETVWADAGFELAEPYKLYQVLVADGIRLDGTNGKPYIYRYTGGCANPNITWVPVFFDADDELIVAKYVNGIRTDITKDSGVFGQVDYNISIDKTYALKYLNGKVVAAYFDGTKYYKNEDGAAVPFTSLSSAVTIPHSGRVDWSVESAPKHNVPTPIAEYVQP